MMTYNMRQIAQGKVSYKELLLQVLETISQALSGYCLLHRANIRYTALQFPLRLPRKVVYSLFSIKQVCCMENKVIIVVVIGVKFQMLVTVILN